MGAFVIVGGSSSIGGSVAQLLVDRGDSTLLLGRSAEKLTEVASRLGQPCSTIESFTSDAIEAPITSFASTHGGLNGIVNCIGSLWLKPLSLTKDEDFREVVATNLFSSFAAVRVGAKLMKDRGGSIVLISSVAASYGLRNHEAIAAAKGGIEGLMLSAAASLAPSNIRVNCVAPGLTKTEMTKRLWENPMTSSASAEMHPLGRLGEPKHVASMIAFLLDPANDWITGQVFGVDGGLSSVQATRKVTAS